MIANWFQVLDSDGKEVEPTADHEAQARALAWACVHGVGVFYQCDEGCLPVEVKS